MTEIGTRVWVVRDADDVQVNAYGYGIYVGQRPMPGWDSPGMLATCERVLRKEDASPVLDPDAIFGALVACGKMTREEADRRIAEVNASVAAEQARPMAERALDLARSVSSSPLIELEAGSYVWGAECWWGEADGESVARFAKGRRIVNVPAPDRSEAVDDGV